MVAALFSLLATSNGRVLVDKGSIVVNQGLDSEQKLYVVSPPTYQGMRCDDKITVEDGTGVRMTWGGECRHFLANNATNEMGPHIYHNFDLLGAELSFDVDISNVDCSCNSALFFTGMPGFASNAHPRTEPISRAATREAARQTPSTLTKRAWGL